MSVNYDLYETPDLAKSGEEQPLHARVVLKGSYTAEEFVEQVTVFQHMPHAQVVGVIAVSYTHLDVYKRQVYAQESVELNHFTDSCKYIAAATYCYGSSCLFQFRICHL